MEQIIAPIVVPSVSTKTAHALMVKTIVLRLMPRLVLLLFMAFLPQELPLLTGLSTKTVLILQHLHQKVNRIYEIIPQTKRNSPPRELKPRLKPQRAISRRALVLVVTVVARGRRWRDDCEKDGYSACKRNKTS